MTFVSNRELDGKDITITIRFVNKVSKAEIKIIQFFDNIMKECFNYLKLQQIGRNFYDRSNKVISTVTTFKRLSVRGKRNAP
jgi:aubergine-like protein